MDKLQTTKISTRLDRKLILSKGNLSTNKMECNATNARDIYTFNPNTQHI